MLADPSTRALYLFPTKALAQDQLAELKELTALVNEAAATEISAFTYDGDTPQDARRAIRTRAHIVLSNPDMVHSGILPHHPKWARLFENLRFVVIDELHAYRGVFGSHLGNVLRRLRRICRHYGSDPIFICSSATIANPRELAERLTERPFELVEESGAPRGEKAFLFVNPPVVNKELGIRRSYLSEARRVAGEFLKRQLQLIVFCQSRLSTEILTTYLKDDFEGPPGTPEQVRGYRGGYLPLRRREIERGLREGLVRAVVATNALELGIDIGALDTVVMAGYPGTIASTWQRAGRAGRRQGRSAAVMVASSAPIDQFVVRNPSYFFDASPEHALINPDNLHILLDHVKCAAFELPFGADERFGLEEVQEILRLLAEEGFVHLVDDAGAGQWNWTNESYPADAVSLRSISSDNFVIVDMTRGADIIGETDFTSALSTLHEKAIYLVEGRAVPGGEAGLRGPQGVRPLGRVRLLHGRDHLFARHDPRRVQQRGRDRAARLARSVSRVPLPAMPAFALKSHGDVRVVSRVVGFKKIKFYTNENVGSGELDLPEQQMHTTAYWLTLSRVLMTSLPFSLEDRRDGVAGLAFAMKQVAQLLLMCDRQDLGLSIGAGDEGAVTDAAHVPDDLDEPRIFLYDSYPGGIGFSEPLFGMHDALLADTRRLIAGCPCDHGCPTCVGPAGESGRAPRPFRSPSSTGSSTACPHDDEPREPAAGNPARASRRTVRRVARGAQGAQGAQPQSTRICDPLPRSRVSQAADVFDGDILQTSSGACLVVDRFYPADHSTGSCGSATCPDARWRRRRSSRSSAGSPSRSRREPRALLFVDLETTGLAGGAGTYAFLVGCAYFEPHGFRIRQYFLPGYQHERPLLDAVEGLVRASAGLVSYNGKSFDVPVLETRYQFNRLAPPFEGMAHVDMLHVARRFWRAAPAGPGAWPDTDSCRLAALERILFGVRRVGDVGGTTSRAATSTSCARGTPCRCCRSSSTTGSTCCRCRMMTARALHVLRLAPEGCTSARECLAAGRLLDRAGRGELAMRCFEDAVERARHERGGDAGLVGPRRSTRWRCACAERAATTTRRCAGTRWWTSANCHRPCGAKHSRRSPFTTSTGSGTSTKRAGSPRCRWPNVWGRREWRPAATGWRGSMTELAGRAVGPGGIGHTTLSLLSALY